MAESSRTSSSWTPAGGVLAAVGLPHRRSFAWSDGYMLITHVGTLFDVRLVSSTHMSVRKSLRSIELGTVLTFIIHLLWFRLADDEQDYRRVISTVAATGRLEAFSVSWGGHVPCSMSAFSPLLRQKGVVDLVLLQQRQKYNIKDVACSGSSDRCSYGVAASFGPAAAAAAFKSSPDVASTVPAVAAAAINCSPDVAASPMPAVAAAAVHYLWPTYLF